jgi:hypothetical protein
LHLKAKTGSCSSYFRLRRCVRSSQPGVKLDSTCTALPKPLAANAAATAAARPERDDPLGAARVAMAAMAARPAAGDPGVNIPCVQGLMDTTRHVIGCHIIQKRWLKTRLMVVIWHGG